MNKRILQVGLMALALSCLMLAGGCSDANTQLEPPKYKTGLGENELRSSALKEKFPAQYASYQKNNESTVMTEYKGSVPFQTHNDLDALLKGPVARDPRNHIQCC